VKGILCPEDAVRAIDEGVDAIVVSNHGGHNVDGSPATLWVLPEIVETVDERVEVYLDGGIRRGSDVVKALALALRARAVLIGRANVYAHAAAGERGVVEMLEVLRSGMEQSLKPLGCASVQALGRSCVEVPATWQDRSVARARDVRS
jgi:isopentenyl diphosphate isomerase/L-lactate dehydrogenase-like FMN-dependent dehydrogenase